MISIDVRAFDRDAYALGREIRRAIIGARKRAFLASLEATSRELALDAAVRELPRFRR
jgi:hypothetical protein